MSEIKALVVEDHVINQELIREILEGLGCRVITAKNGREAIEFAGKEEFDIVFMDLQMPEMDGYQATSEMRKMGGRMKEIPIIALTASALEQDKSRCFEVGMTDFITKPYEFQDIEKLLNRLFKK